MQERARAHGKWGKVETHIAVGAAAAFNLEDFMLSEVQSNWVFSLKDGDDIQFVVSRRI